MATVPLFEPPAVVETSTVFGGTTEEPGANDFDEVARTLSDGLTAQLSSLRAIVLDAVARRDADRREIERLG
jgi:hypothetical protein